MSMRRRFMKGGAGPLQSILLAVMCVACGWKDAASALADPVAGDGGAAERQFGVPISLRNTAGVRQSRLPVTFGVPIPQGMLETADGIMLVSPDGTPIPAQIEVANRWPEGKSIRWLHVDFQADLSGKHQQGYRLVQSEADAPTPPESIRVSEKNGFFEVANGTTTFLVNRKQFKGIDRVTDKASGDVLYEADDTAGLYFLDGLGRRHSAAGGPPDSVILEEKGPLRAVIRAEGWYHGPDSVRRGRYVVRTHFYAGQPFVRMFHTFIVTDDTETASFNDIGVRFSVKADSAVFGGTPGLKNFARQQSTYLLQYDSDKFLMVGNGAQKVTWGEASGDRAPGWASVFSKGRMAATLAVRDFWQQFPKEIEVIGEEALIFHAWPAHGVAKTDRVIEDAMLQYLWFCHEGKTLSFKVPEAVYGFKGGHAEDEYRYLRGSKSANCMGLAKTHELLVSFARDEPPANLGRLALFQEPPACMPSAKWMCASGVFGKIHPYDAERFPEWERGMSKAFDCELRLQDSTRDYGMFNFGDGHTAWDFTRNRWDDVYRCWRAMHHGAPRVPWLLYVRSGDPKYLQQGVRSARHLIDIGICHHSTPEWENKPYPVGKIVGALNDYKGIVHWHAGNRLFDYNAMTDFMLYYWHLTGDRRGLDVAKEWGESAKARYQENNPIPNREGGGTIDAAIEMYLETGDQRYKKIAATNVAFFLDKVQNMGQAEKAGGRVATTEGLPRGAFPQWENYAPWLQKYWELTGSEKVGERIVAWGDAYLAGNGDACSRQERAYMNILAYAYFVSQDPRFLAHGQDEANRYVRTIQDTPGSLLDGFPHWQQLSLGNGFMMQRIPYLMAALADYGKPPPPAMSCMPAPKGSRLLYVVEGEKPSSFVEAHVLNADGNPFSISTVVEIIVAKLPITMTVVSPSGKTVHEETKDIEAGRHAVAIKVPAPAEQGVYKIRIATTPPSSYWQVLEVTTSPQLKTVYELPRRTLNATSCRYYFLVPEAAKSVVVRAMDCESLHILDPDGNAVASVPFTFNHQGELKAEVPPGMAGRPWAFQGEFGKRSYVEISGEGVAVPQYVAIAPELLFEP